MTEIRNETEQQIRFPVAVVFAIISAVFQFVNILLNLRFLQYGLSIWSILTQGLFLASTILLIVGLFVQKNRGIFIAALALMCLTPLRGVINLAFAVLRGSLMLYNLAMFAAHLLRLASIVLTLVFAIVAFRKETDAARLCGKVWFVPGVLSFFCLCGFAVVFRSQNVWSLLQIFLGELPMAFLLGWWLTHPYKRLKQPSYGSVQNVVSYGGFQPVSSGPAPVQAREFCIRCGREFPPGEQFCSACGQKRAGPAPRVSYQPAIYEPDIPSDGMNALSFFFPVVGLILYLVWRDQTPVKANAVGKFALIGLIVWTVFGILLTVFLYTIPLIIFAWSF